MVRELFDVRNAGSGDTPAKVQETYLGIVTCHF